MARAIGTQEFIKMVAETELMVCGVAKGMWLIEFSGPRAMEIAVHINNGTFVQAGVADYRTLQYEEVRGMVRGLMRRIVELATTPRG